MATPTTRFSLRWDSEERRRIAASTQLCKAREAELRDFYTSTRASRLRRGTSAPTGLASGTGATSEAVPRPGRPDAIGIARFGGLDHSTVSKSLLRMEQAGLLKRVADKEDKRALRAHLTTKGRAVRPRIRSMWSTLEKVSVSGLDESTKRMFINIAGRIQQSIMNR